MNKRILVDKILNSTKHPVLVFTIVVIALTIILPFRGFFFLNDSQIYAKGVENFLRGEFRLCPLAGSTGLFQTVLGALTAEFFGFSPTLLRSINIVLGLIGVIFFFYLLRELDLGYHESLFGGFFLLFSPFYLVSMYSFMTEVPFLSMLFVSFYFYVRGVNKRSLAHIFIGSIFCTLSFLSRQLGLFSCIVAAMYFLAKYRKIDVLKLFLMCAFPLLVFAWYQWIYPSPLGYRYFSLSYQIQFLKTFPILLVCRRLVHSLYYFGLLFSPLVLGTIISNWDRLNKRLFLRNYMFSFVLLSCFSGFFWFTEKSLMFYIPNTLSYAGFMPQGLSTGLKQSIFVGVPVRVGVVITFLSVCFTSAGISFLVSCWRKFVDFLRERPILILFFYSLFVCPFVFLFRSFYDRYLLVLFPFMIALLLHFVSRRGLKVAVAAFLGLVLIVVAFEYDYLSLNRGVGKIITSSKVDKSLIYSTSEFNEWFHLDEVKNIDDPEQLFLRRSWLLKREEAAQVVSYTPVEGWCVKERHFYITPLGKNFRIPLYVLEKGL